MIGTPKPIFRHPLENTVTVTLRRKGVQNLKALKKFWFKTPKSNCGFLHINFEDF